MIGVVKRNINQVRPIERVEIEDPALKKGHVTKLVVKYGAWNERRWNPRWLELHKGELRYFLFEGGKIIDRMIADQISEVKPIISAASKEPEQAASICKTSDTDNNKGEHTESDGKEMDTSQAGRSVPTLWETVSNQRDDISDLQHCFFVSTKADNDHRGREYVFKAATTNDMQEWVDKINKMLQDAIPPPETAFSWLKDKVRAFYSSDAFQIAVAVMIFINFLAYVYFTQFNPPSDSPAGRALTTVDTVLSIGFGIELLLNLFCHDFFKEFLPDVWNWFDVTVVVTSIVAIPFDGVPGLNELRLVRVLRIFRLFKSIQSLNKIVAALQESVPAVSNAFGLVFLMCSIYAILGVTFFGDTLPENFGDFATTMFTLYQFLTFDNACAITLELMDQEATDGGQFGAAIFMITFQIGMAYTLMNIGMAVLLEEFGTCAQRARDEEKAKSMDEEGDKSRKALDPIMSRMMAMESEEALGREILELFQFIDEDGSGRIDYIEMRNGFMRMELNPPVVFEAEDFDAMVVQPGLHDEEGSMTVEHFGAMLRGQLREYELALMRRSVVEGRVQDKVNTILHSLKEVVSSTRAIKGLERQVADLDRRFTTLEMEASCVPEWAALLALPPPPPPAIPAP